MPTNHKSPYASSFKSAMKLGTPCGVAVNTIAKNSKKSPKMVFESLFKAGLCFRQKFNGQFVYWTSEKCKKGTATVRNECQHNMWQCFIDWFISSGFCTPEQLKNHCGSQQEFMAFCRKFFASRSAPPPARRRERSARQGVSQRPGSAPQPRPRSARPRPRPGNAPQPRPANARQLVSPPVARPPNVAATSSRPPSVVPAPVVIAELLDQLCVVF